MTDYLEWLLQRNDGLWQPPADEASAMAQAWESAANISLPARVLRHRLAPASDATQYGAENDTAQLSRALQEVSEAHLRVRRMTLAHTAQQTMRTPDGAARRTGGIGSLFAAEESNSQEGEAFSSMAEISRFFERDARRYG